MKTEEEIVSLLSRDYSNVGYHLKALWMAANAEDRKRLQEAFPEKFEDRTCKWRISGDDELPHGHYWDEEGKLGRINSRGKWETPGVDGDFLISSGYKLYGPLVPPKVSE